MAIHTPAIVIPRSRRGPGRRQFLGLAAAALALTVGAGLWQAGRDGGSERAMPPAVAVAQPAARPPESTPTYYLVSSQAEADAERAIAAQLGVTPLPEVVTVATTADADAFFQAMAEQDAVRDQLGLPAVTVVDRRAWSVGPEGVATNVVSALDEAPVIPTAGAMGGLTELIRDGGTPASVGLQATTRGGSGACDSMIGLTDC